MMNRKVTKLSMSFANKNRAALMIGGIGIRDITAPNQIL